MERNPKCYVYEPGKYVAVVRALGRSSLMVSIPKQIWSKMKLRSGMEVMVTIEVAEPNLVEAPSEEASQ